MVFSNYKSMQTINHCDIKLIDTVVFYFLHFRYLANFVRNKISSLIGEGGQKKFFAGNFLEKQ